MSAIPTKLTQEAAMLADFKESAANNPNPAWTRGFTAGIQVSINHLKNKGASDYLDDLIAFLNDIQAACGAAMNQQRASHEWAGRTDAKW